MIVGQCTQILLDRMKQELNWEKVSIFYDLLALIDIVDTTVMAQTEYHYPSAIVYDQE